MCQLRDHKYIKITKLNDNNEDILHNKQSCNRPINCLNDQLFMPNLHPLRSSECLNEQAAITGIEIFIIQNGEYCQTILSIILPINFINIYQSYFISTFNL